MHHTNELQSPPAILDEKVDGRPTAPRRKKASRSVAANADPLKLIRNKRFLECVGQNFDEIDKRLGELSHAEVDSLREQAIPNVARAKLDAARAFLEMGANLWCVQVALVKKDRTGDFSAFLVDVGLSRTNAYTAINAFVAFRDCSNLEQFNRFAPSALRILGAPNVPQQARHLAIEKAKAGEQITVQIAQQLVGKKKPQPRDSKESTINLPTTADELITEAGGDDDERVVTIRCPKTHATVHIRSQDAPLTPNRLAEVLREVLRMYEVNSVQGEEEERVRA